MDLLDLRAVHTASSETGCVLKEAAVAWLLLLSCVSSLVKIFPLAQGSK